MGAYLYYKTLSNPEEVDKFLREHPLNKKIEAMDEMPIYIYCQEDVKWAEENQPSAVDYYKSKIGTGDIKTSGYALDDEEYEELAEMWTRIFEELNEKFGMKYYARSCSLDPDSGYFTMSQLKRITGNGKYLSGKSSKKEYVVELYNKYYELFSKQAFDIEKIKHDDKVIMDDGVEYTVQGSSEKFLSKKGYGKYAFRNLSEVANNIKRHIKFVPKMEYGGAICDLEAYVVTSDGVLIYSEVVGNENAVKSVSSMVMQGRTKMKDKELRISGLSWFKLHKKGNKRRIISLGEGLAHALVYHADSISNNGFNVIIGENEEELFEAFSQWMERSQPLPYPKEIERDLYDTLYQEGYLKDTRSFGIVAKEIDKRILEDEYSILAEKILGISINKGLAAEPRKLPKSPYLTEEQVEAIYEKLDNMPKTYELNGFAFKPIGLKLFAPDRTIYIVEADKEMPDEKHNMHTQVFGYAEILSYPEDSEWGYFSIPELLSVSYPGGFGFEMDLYFEDMYISPTGKVGSIDEVMPEGKILCIKCASEKVTIQDNEEMLHCSCECGYKFTIKNTKNEKEAA